MSERTERLYAVCAGVQGRIVLTGHDHADVDSVISCLLMRRLLAAWGMEARIALPTGMDRQSVRVLSACGIDAAALESEIAAVDNVILLDHHQPLHGGRVIACVDHHPTAVSPAYPYVQIEQRGACAMQVFSLMCEAGIDVTEQDERLAVTALWLDTIALRSAKITCEEADWGRMRAQALNMDIAMLEREGMGLADLTCPAHELAMLQKKTYDFAGRRMCSTSIQTNGMTPDLLEEIVNVLRAEIVCEGAALWVCLVNDPMAERSLRIDIYPDGHAHEIRYGFLASRGKNVMPDVERMMMQGDTRQEETHGGI